MRLKVSQVESAAASKQIVQKRHHNVGMSQSKRDLRIFLCSGRCAACSETSSQEWKRPLRKTALTRLHGSFSPQSPLHSSYRVPLMVPCCSPDIPIVPFHFPTISPHILVVPYCYSALKFCLVKKTLWSTSDSQVLPRLLSVLCLQEGPPLLCFDFKTNTCCSGFGVSSCKIRAASKYLFECCGGVQASVYGLQHSDGRPEHGTALHSVR